MIRSFGRRVRTVSCRLPLRPRSVQQGLLGGRDRDQACPRAPPAERPSGLSAGRDSPAMDGTDVAVRKFRPVAVRKLDERAGPLVCKRRPQGRKVVEAMSCTSPTLENRRRRPSPPPARRDGAFYGQREADALAVPHAPYDSFAAMPAAISCSARSSSRVLRQAHESFRDVRIVLFFEQCDRVEAEPVAGVVRPRWESQRGRSSRSRQNASISVLGVSRRGRMRPSLRRYSIAASPDACAAQDAQQHRFGLVVAVVRQSDPHILHPPPSVFCLRNSAPPRLSGFFFRDLSSAAFGTSHRRPRAECQGPHRVDEPRYVLFGLPAAHAVIDVNTGKRKAELVLQVAQNVQQAQGIRAAGQAQHDAVTRGDETVFLYGVLDSGQGVHNQIRSAGRRSMPPAPLQFDIEELASVLARPPGHLVGQAFDFGHFRTVCSTYGGMFVFPRNARACRYGASFQPKDAAGRRPPRLARATRV